MSDYEHSGLKLIQVKVFELADAALRKRLHSIADQLREITNLKMVNLLGLKVGEVDIVNADLVLNNLIISIFEQSKHAYRAMEAERFVDRVRHIEKQIGGKEGDEKGGES